MKSDLSQRLVQLLQDALLVKHLSLIPVLVVVVDPLPHVGGELVERHVLLHLFVLRQGEKLSCSKWIKLFKLTCRGNNCKINVAAFLAKAKCKVMSE